MRNAVKAVVDAYDGTVDLYAWDEDDPMLQTWQKAYPGVVKPRSAISRSAAASSAERRSDFCRLRRVAASAIGPSGIASGRLG